MRKAILLLLTLAFVTAPVWAQQGSVSGTVYDGDNNPVADARVGLSGGGGGHHHHGNMYSTFSGDDGTFSLTGVTPGNYTAFAAKMGFGHDSEEIEVVAGQDTQVDFILTMGGHDGGGHCDSLVIVELEGWAIVVEDSFFTHYYLDVDNDGDADYRLAFGPEWYDPGSGATRPQNGDFVTIVGGLMGYSEPQTVVVYEINGLFWREPGSGHGGHGGNGGGCDPDSIELIETSGIAIVEQMHEMNMYFLDEDFDNEADYHLNFGAPWYDPGNGATRPDDGDSVEIVGGLMYGCPYLPVIIVYEINGQFWREPGDTTLLWLEPTSIDESEVPAPREFVIASAYPNPFNAVANISFVMPNSGHALVAIYDLLGRQVTTLANGTYAAGRNVVKFDTNQIGGTGSSIYFYRVETEYGTATGKLVLLK